MYTFFIALIVVSSSIELVIQCTDLNTYFINQSQQAVELQMKEIKRQKTEQYKQLIEATRSGECTDALKQSIQHWYKEDWSLQVAIESAIRRKNAKFIRYVFYGVKDKKECCCYDQDYFCVSQEIRCNALIYAAYHDFKGIVADLLRNKEIGRQLAQKQDIFGYTALMRAIVEGHTKMLQHCHLNRLHLSNLYEYKSIR